MAKKYRVGKWTLSRTIPLGPEIWEKGSLSILKVKGVEYWKYLKK